MLSNSSCKLRYDLLVTALVTALVCWFSYQYGYNNSPDSYYRGLLAKSILEGHPYVIGMRQGWLYDISTWHHNAAHEPLLPLIYAAMFLAVGAKISVTNVVSSLAAGLFIFPLLQLSRRLTGNAIIGFLIYISVVLNEGISYFFELNAGLSITTYTLLLSLIILNFDVVIHSTRRAWIWTCAIWICAFYITRSEAQPLLFLVAVVSLWLAPRFLDPPAVNRVRHVWLLSFLLVLPWLLRKIILFGNPIFSHMSPLLWVDDEYDYWRYLESGEYPSLSTYFDYHTINDFLAKLFVKGPRGIYSALEQGLPGPAWLYPLLILFSLVTIACLVRDNKRRFLFAIIFTFIAGYIGLFSIVPVYVPRYLITPLFLILLVVSVAVSLICIRLFPSSRTTGIYISIAILAASSVPMQLSFWRNIDGYLRYAYTTSDQSNEKDLTVIALRNRFPFPREVDRPILGPFAEVQRLSFLTGLPIWEAPTNLKELADPLRFFRRFDIRYSLVDISKLFHTGPDVRWKSLGNHYLFEVPQSEETDSLLLADIDTNISTEVIASISNGVSSRLAFVNSRVSSRNLPFEHLSEMGVRTRVFQEKFHHRERELYQSGFLILSYKHSMDPLSKEELDVIYKFLDNGGRLLILCPGWVWTTYQEKPLGELPYNQILQYFNVAITADYVSPPYTTPDSLLGPEAITSLSNVTASEIIYGRGAVPVILGADEKALAIRVTKGKARAVIFGHDYLLSQANFDTAGGYDSVQHVFDWLLAQDSTLSE